MSSDGILPDPDKVKALSEMRAPKDKAGVTRFLGLVTYLSKFIPHLSTIDAPLRSLLKENVDFEWSHKQTESFQQLKSLCSAAPALGFFDPKKPIEIQCDASKDGLGTILMQNGKCIAYSSRAMTAAETRYAQIEKEMLSIVHAANKFHCYIFGASTTVYNDHKPLEAIFKKPLNAAPMRLQRMLLRLQCYNLNVKYRSGPEMFLADELSRAYLPLSSENTTEYSDLKFNMLDYIPVTPERYEDIQMRTAKELSLLCATIQTGWPINRQEVPVELRKYWDAKDCLAVLDGIVYKKMRIVVPLSLINHMLRLIHSIHTGIVKRKCRYREVLYWPGMSADIETVVKDCKKCATYQNKFPKEPLKPHRVPDLPFREVSVDLFEFESKNYYSNKTHYTLSTFYTTYSVYLLKSRCIRKFYDA